MWSATTIILFIIFILVLLIIIVTLVFFNRTVAAVPLITDFGLTVRNLNSGLYMSIENITSTSGATGIFPIMTVKALSQGQPAEPTEGWVLNRPTDTPTGTTVTFFNPSNSGYIQYTTNSAGTSLDPNYILVDRPSVPPDPSASTGPSNIGWFSMSQLLVGNTTITTFKSIYPGQLNGQDQYLIPGVEGSASPSNPNIIPVTIGVPNNNNHYWVVGGAT